MSKIAFKAGAKNFVDGRTASQSKFSNKKNAAILINKLYKITEKNV